MSSVHRGNIVVVKEILVERFVFTDRVKGQ